MSSKNQAAESTENTAIQVTNLSKFYRLYEKPEDRLKESICSAFNRLRGAKPISYCQEFRALSGVSFSVKKGETVGIIGRNGSGKSTLLQMICGTLCPSGGTIDVDGRVAALLELGSGFNPEFTGRENVYMNAAILGMAEGEVEGKFDEIAAFADIGEFIEQPVKTYSSGMMLRLAFAVIAHVNADILVIDEALAVGDAVFMQKCMRFIKSFQETRTLLFVSHDLAAVKNLCTHSIWLEKGEIRAIGTSKDITNAYLQFTLQEAYGEGHLLSSLEPGGSLLSPAQIEFESIPEPLDYGGKVCVRDNTLDANGWKTGKAELLAVYWTSKESEIENTFKGGEKVRLTIKAVAHERLDNPILGFIVKDRLGQDLFGENTLPFTDISPIQVKSGETFKAEFDFVLPMLQNGEYVVMASVADGTIHDHVQHHYLHDALVITVSSCKVRWGLTGLAFDRASMEIVNEP